MRTTISSISVRIIRLRVAGVAPGLCQARSRLAPEREQAFPVGRGERRLRACRQRVLFVFQAAHRQEALVPASLQLGRDEAVVGVDGVVLPPCTGRFVTRLLEGEFDVALLLALLDPARLQGIDRRLKPSG